MSRFTALPTITDDSALGGSTIERSLRFNGSDTYIQRTSSGGNRRTWTVSFWAKFCDSSATIDQRFWSCDGNSGNYDMLKIEFYGGTDSARRIAIIDQGHAGNGIRFTLKRKFRDSSAWYHFVLAQDTSQSTNTNRVFVFACCRINCCFHWRCFSSSNLFWRNSVQCRKRSSFNSGYWYL